jgi:hypothetical protein
MNKNYYKYQKYLYKYAQLLKNQKKLKGGANIPEQLPATQSWIFMPFILLPFDNLLIHFNYDVQAYINEYFADFNLHNKEQITNYIRDQIRILIPDINFNDRISLGNNVPPLNLQYDDADHLHLTGASQERLLERMTLRSNTFGIDLNMRDILSTLANELINRFPNNYFDFMSIDNIE